MRVLARKLNVDLAMVTPTGTDGMITPGDVQRAARVLAEQGPIELLRGVRRAMAQNMMLANAEVASATIMDDADIHAWEPGTNVMLRLIRAIVAGCRAEPSLNAWYDSQRIGRWVVKKIDLGIAVDTPDGLLVPVLRNVGERAMDDLAAGLDEPRARRARAQGAARRTARPHHHALELRHDRGALCLTRRGAARQWPSSVRVACATRWSRWTARRRFGRFFRSRSRSIIARCRAGKRDALWPR